MKVREYLISLGENIMLGSLGYKRGMRITRGMERTGGNVVKRWKHYLSKSGKINKRMDMSTDKRIAFEGKPNEQIPLKARLLRFKRRGY